MSLDRVTVFFSWQKDLPNRANWGFIEGALKRALAELPRFGGEALSLSAAFDRDTAGRRGSPDIASAIFSKIDAADAFVCDVSIINKPRRGKQRYRLVPNPNVLTELGYAAKKMGWDSIVCVFNEAFGKVEELPFDLRGRRILKYRLAPEEPKAEVRAQLVRDLVSALDPIVRAAWEAHRPHPVRFAAYLDVALMANRFLMWLAAAHTHTTLGPARALDEVLTAGVFDEALQNLWLEAKVGTGQPVGFMLCHAAKDFSERGEKILNRYGLNLHPDAYGAIHTALDSGFLAGLCRLLDLKASDSAQGIHRPALLGHWTVVEERAIDALRRLHLWCRGERQELSVYDGGIRSLEEVVPHGAFGLWRIPDDVRKREIDAWNQGAVGPSPGG